MRTANELTDRFTVIEHQWIPMDDGVRLAARIFLPNDAHEHPVPAILEYIPYRKRDYMRPRDTGIHGWFAAHGYASVRLDIRGSGESEGVLTDEYLQRELDDGCAALEWIAAQPWCNGATGMIGISWGGFNGLMIAAMQPPSLKAIISLCSTDDRYADDVHYMGGCLLGDNLSWASTMFAYNSSPPDPALVGERWRDMWMDRLRHSGLWLEQWLHHQHRDAYWKHGSVCEDLSRITIPVLAASGWADGYSNAVFRLVAGLEHAPAYGLIGPWSHRYPHMGIPGPAIGFLQECRRWWDHWLKGADQGVTREPRLRVWMLDSIEPAARYHHRPGRWAAHARWPSPGIRMTSLALGNGELSFSHDRRGDHAPRTIQSPSTVGHFAGKWCSYSAAPDLPGDQRDEDGGSLVFETQPLREKVDILGMAEVRLKVASSEPVAMVAARISDVAPNGKATRVTYGMLNLTHRDGHEDPEPLTPGEPVTVCVQLNGIAQSFPKGHTIRLSLSSSYWPLAWLPPRSAMLTVFPADSALVLPLRVDDGEDARIRPFEPPETAPFSPRTTVHEGKSTWRVIRDLASEVDTLEVIKDDGVWNLEDIDLQMHQDSLERYSVTSDDFGSARGETNWERGFRRGDWHVYTRTKTVVRCDAERFYLHAQLDAFEGEERVFSRNWRLPIARKLV
jgi:putative CocE/NonD family hydrolase